MRIRESGGALETGTPGRILLLKAGDNHSLSFRRGKLMLPSSIVRYGELPRVAARRALKEQLENPEVLKDPEFAGMQSYLGAHWDIVFLFNSAIDGSGSIVRAKAPFVQAGFFEVNALPRDEVADDHLEVIDAMLHPSEETGA